jgi:glycosyltransferase involved in cell wall biosynthesis
MIEPESNPPSAILFTHYGEDWIRGSERCLLDLLSHLDKDKFTALLWCNQPSMANEAKKLGIKVYCCEFPLLLGWSAPRFNIRAFLGLIRQAIALIDKHQITLIHANSAAPCQWLNFAARKRHIPLIAHLHSFYQLRDRLTLGLYQVPLLIGINYYVINDLKNDKMPNSRMQVIANGIDTQKLLAQKRLNLRAALDIDVGDFVLATVGSLILRKGVDLIIAALAQLTAAKNCPVDLLIIGSGEQENNLKQQIKELDLQKRITLLGEQKNIHGILRGTVDLFISAAREEAFGLVLAEASLAGIAVVAPAVGGISNVVIDGHSGILVPPEDVNALSAAIEKLYLNPLLSNAMGKAGRQHVLENLTIEKNCQHFEHLYEQLLSFPAAQRPGNKNWSLRLSFNSAWRRLTNKRVTYDE